MTYKNFFKTMENVAINMNTQKNCKKEFKKKELAVFIVKKIQFYFKIQLKNIMHITKLVVRKDKIVI